MKFISIAISLLFICSFLRAQAPISLESPLIGERINKVENFPILKGVLRNYNPEVLKDLFVNVFVTVPNRKNQVTRNAEIKGDGSFTFKLEDGLPYHQIYLKVGKYYEGFLILNKNLEINLDFKLLSKNPVKYSGKGVSFSGEDGKLNEYYSKFFVFENSKKRTLNNKKASQLLNRISQPEYKANQIRDIYKELEKIENSFSRKNGKEYQWILEDERKSNFYTDLISVYLNRDMNAKVWQECLDFKPKTTSLSTNQYYDIIGFILQDHSEREIKSLTRDVLISRLDNEKEKDNVKLFLKEVEKKNAGVDYDNEIVVKGLEDYMKDVDVDIENAKNQLFLRKLSKIENEKIGLIVSMIIPLNIDDRRLFLNMIEKALPEHWTTEKMYAELNRDSINFENISKSYEAGRRGGGLHKLGEKLIDLVSGAVLYNAYPIGISDMLSRIRNVYPDEAIILHFWSVSDLNSIEELRQSGLLMDKIEFMPVKVVHLCLDENTSTQVWKETIENVFIKGDHILLNNQLSSEMINYFDIQNLPSCIFFGIKGDFDPYFINRLQDLQIRDLRNKLDSN